MSKKRVKKNKGWEGFSFFYSERKIVGNRKAGEGRESVKTFIGTQVPWGKEYFGAMVKYLERGQSTAAKGEGVQQMLRKEMQAERGRGNLR